MSSEASVNSLARVEAMLLPAEKSEAEISWRLPMTKVTAMVSPMARPRPRKQAPTIPWMP